jgi:acetyl esterase/lipase
MRSVLFIIYFLSLFAVGIHSQDNPPPAVVYPAGYVAEIDRVYTRAGNWEGRMDIYYQPGSTAPMPVVIHIHGGGWNHGSKESQTGFSSWFKMGFAVVNIAYRLVDVAPAPAAIEDVRAALYFVKTNASKYNFNPDKVVMSGGSAGAHLALMGGLLGNNRMFDDKKKKEVDMRVAAILSNYAPTDFTDTNSEMSRFKSLVRWLGAKANDRDFRAAVSPVTHITADSPPVFIVHGDADPIVPYEQSVVLQQKLEHFQVPNNFITVKGGLHGKFEKADRDSIATGFRAFLVNVKVIDN